MEGIKLSERMVGGRVKIDGTTKTIVEIRTSQGIVWPVIYTYVVTELQIHYSSGFQLAASGENYAWITGTIMVYIGSQLIDTRRNVRLDPIAPATGMFYVEDGVIKGENLGTRVLPSRVENFSASYASTPSAFTVAVRQEANMPTQVSTYDSESAAGSVSAWTKGGSMAHWSGDYAEISLIYATRRKTTKNVFPSGSEIIVGETYEDFTPAFAFSGDGLVVTQSGNIYELDWQFNSTLVRREGRVELTTDDGRVLWFVNLEQSSNVSGRAVFQLVDESGLPLYGASAIIPGTTIAYSSDSEGYISIPETVIRANNIRTIVCSMIGYEDYSIRPPLTQYLNTGIRIIMTPEE